MLALSHRLIWSADIELYAKWILGLELQQRYSIQYFGFITGKMEHALQYGMHVRNTAV